MAVALAATTSLVLGIGASAASAVVTVSVHPYATGLIGVGATDPGGPDSELCLVTNQDDPPTYTGNINGGVGPQGAALSLNITRKNQAGDNVSTCVLTPIEFKTDDATTLFGDNVAPKTGGYIQLGTSTSVQSGISAVGQTRLQFDYGANMCTVLPAGAVIVSGTLCNGANPGSVVLDMKPFVTATKSALTTSCSDARYVVDYTFIVDAPTSPTDNDEGGPGKYPSPKAYAFDDPDNLFIDADGYDPTDTTDHDPNPALDKVSKPSETYPATMRSCAQSQTPVAGKVIKTKIAFTGNGTATIKFVKAVTAAPRTWDMTRGSKCGGIKVGGTFGGLPESSRVMQCSGNFGKPIPFVIDVRNFLTDAGGGKTDPYGILHPGPVVTLTSATFLP